MNKDALLKAIKRIKAIKWKEYYTRTDSHIELLHEGLRREALWIKKLGIKGDWPFSDLSIYIEDDDEEVNLNEIEEFIELEKYLKNKRLGDIIHNACIRSVKLAGLEDCKKYPRLPNLYEPLIRMFERGGHINRAKDGHLHVLGTDFIYKSPGEYLQSQPLFNFSDENLDTFDKKETTTNKDKIASAIKRIKAIRWEDNHNRKTSHLCLLVEGFRRMALWVKTLDLKHAGKFADLSFYIDIDNDELALDEVPEINELEEYLKKKHLGAYVVNTCIRSVKLAALEDTKKYIELDLPKPFEPYIRMYERGGRIRQEHNCIELLYSNYILKPFEEYIDTKPLLDLSDEALDKLDEEEN